MKKIIVKIFKIIFNLIYSIFKLFKVQNKVVMLSRQGNIMSVDFELLKEEFEKRGVKTVVLCKTIDPGMISKIKYGFHLLISSYHLATSKYCIVDTYSICVSMLNHRKELKIMQIWHALGAVKKFGYQVLDKEEGSNKETSDLFDMHKNYSYITCASNITKKFYSEAFNTELDKIKVLGMPRIDYILQMKQNKEKRIFKDRPELKEKPIILYVPTFRKKASVEVQELINCVDTEKYNLLINFHPLDNTPVPEKYIIDKKYNTFEIIEIADYIILDYGALGIEATLLNVPIFFWLYDIEQYKENRGLNIDLFKEMPTSTSVNIKEIIDKIEKKEYNFDELEEYRKRYIETNDMENTKRVVDFIMS